jgi:hypothetical protein
MTAFSSSYTSALSSKGALLEETQAVLRRIDQGHSIEDVRSTVVDQDLFGKASRSTRQSEWERIQRRYLTDPDHARTLARMVIHAPDRQTEKLVLFYEFCRSTPLLYDVTIECIYPRYAEGFSGIAKSDIQQYFEEIAPAHPEIAEWSPQTRQKVISNALTVLRDFGLLEGTQRKTFSRLYVPPSAFVYVLYRLAEDGLTAPRQLLEAQDWRLFFLAREDVILLLDEATAAGHCTFKHRGDVYTLDFAYLSNVKDNGAKPSLEACVEALTR